MPFSPSQRWALALAGVLTELNGAHHDEIGGWGENQHTRGWCKNALSRFWGIDDTAAFVRCADWLRDEGHRMECVVMANALGVPAQDTPRQAIVRANRKALQGRSLLGWDLGRLVAITGWGYWAGYVSERDAWIRIMDAAEYAQQVYASWEEFGRHYEIGRIWWANGEVDSRMANILKKLNTDPRSPWVTLPWKLRLDIEGSIPKDAPAQPAEHALHLVKRVTCHACGAPKQLPSKTGWVYCDCCGSLVDWDFRVACSGSLLPGPVYEQLIARLAPELDAARKSGDRARMLALQRQIFAAYVDHCPRAVPPRVGDSNYRKAYIDYMAEASVATEMDPVFQMHVTRVRSLSQGVRFVGDPRNPKVNPDQFWPVYESFRTQNDHAMALHAAFGTLDRHPDGAPPELQDRLSWSLFAQGWIKFLPDADAKRLLEITNLADNYQEIPVPTLRERHCGVCGAELRVVAGARRVVCDGCGHRVEVEAPEIPCTNCAAPISFPENAARVACPHCETVLTRVR